MQVIRKCKSLETEYCVDNLTDTICGYSCFFLNHLDRLKQSLTLVKQT